MPKPIVGPCGGPNQPPCPPEPATEPKGDDGPTAEPKPKKEGFLHRVEDAVGEALGEAFEDR